MSVYCMYDSVAEEAWPLFESVNDGSAIRAYNMQLAQNKLDQGEIKLFYLGVFDRESMELSVGALEEVVAKISLVDEQEEADAEGI